MKIWLAILLSLFMPLLNGVGDVHAVRATTGTLSGIVTNAATAAPIAGATLKVTNAATGATYSATSTSTGSYKLTLPPVTYSLACTATSFQDAALTGASIVVGNTTSLNVTMQPVQQTLDHSGRLSSYTLLQSARYPITA